MGLRWYVQLSVMAVLAAVAWAIVYKYLKLRSKKKTVLSKEDIVGKLFVRKLDKVPAVGEPREQLKELLRTMRSFFSELFDISYQFAYVELNEVLGKRKVSKNMRKRVVDYTMRLSEAEYSGHRIGKEDMSVLLADSLSLIRNLTGVKGEDIISIGKRAEQERKPVEEKLKLGKEEEEALGKLRRLLGGAEGLAKKGDAVKLSNTYSEIRALYDSLPPEMKRNMYDETKRIIRVHNTLLARYKKMLSP